MTRSHFVARILGYAKEFRAANRFTDAEFIESVGEIVDNAEKRMEETCKHLENERKTSADLRAQLDTTWKRIDALKREVQALRDGEEV